MLWEYTALELKNISTTFFLIFLIASIISTVELKFVLNVLFGYKNDFFCWDIAELCQMISGLICKIIFFKSFILE